MKITINTCILFQKKKKKKKKTNPELHSCSNIHVLTLLIPFQKLHLLTMFFFYTTGTVSSSIFRFESISFELYLLTHVFFFSGLALPSLSPQRLGEVSPSFLCLG